MVSPVRDVAVGREAELSAVDAALGRNRVMVVRGAPGMGKTALLGEMEHRCRLRRIEVIRIACSAEEPEWDLFGARAVVAAFRKTFQDSGSPRLTAAMTAVGRAALPQTYGSPSARADLLAELVHLFAAVPGGGSPAVLVDDVHVTPLPALFLTTAYQAGCTVVATCREDGGATGPLSLGALANQELVLGPLPEARIGELVAAAAPGRLDEAVVPALRAALGSLAGNPGVVLETFRDLYEANRFTSVRGYLCLAEPAAPIALAPGNELVRHVAACGGVGHELVAVIARARRFTLDDLPAFADGTGHRPAACGRAVDRLVAVGALAHDQRQGLRLPCPALAATVLAERGDRTSAALHASIARRMLDDDHVMRAEPEAVADQVALAGSTLSAAPAVGEVLQQEADRALKADPASAARWYRAALWHFEPRSPGYVHVLGRAVRALVHVGDHACLGEVVAEGVRAGGHAELRHELAAGAALAAVHTGRPVPETVRTALAGGPAADRPLEFAARWFGRCGPPQAAELAEIFAAFRGAVPVGGDAEDLFLAGQRYDLVSVLQSVLGDGYGVPVTGPLATYHRVVDEYLSGHSAAIPSLVRELELARPSHTPVHQLGRLLVAEACSAEGDARRAAEWLADVTATGSFPALRTWVEVGLLRLAGEHERAWQLGRQACSRLIGDSAEDALVGIGRLLVRLAFLAVEAADALWGEEVLAETRKWRTRLGGEELGATELMVRGLVERNHPGMVTAVETLRRQGNRVDLMHACLIMAGLDSEPRPWLDEAYEIARGIGGDRLRTVVVEAMRERGVAPPRQRADRTTLTEVEENIVALVRDGLTNRQIAASIRMSGKTVETYLTRLFAKTGCRSRLELAAASLEGRLAPITDSGRTPA